MPCEAMRGPLRPLWWQTLYLLVRNYSVESFTHASNHVSYECVTHAEVSHPLRHAGISPVVVKAL